MVRPEVVSEYSRLEGDVEIQQRTLDRRREHLGRIRAVMVAIEQLDGFAEPKALEYLNRSLVNFLAAEKKANFSQAEMVDFPERELKSAS